MGDLSDTVGLQKGELVAVNYGNLFVVVSETDDSKPIVTRESAVDHDRVVRRVLETTTPLPFRFGTLLAPKRLEEYVNFHRERLLESLAKVGGCVEMSFKAIRRGDDLEVASINEGSTVGPGTLFLNSKRATVSLRETSQAQAERFAHQLSTQLKGLLEDSVVKAGSSEGFFLTAGHLIKRQNVSEYKRRVTEMYKPDIEVLVSGPWAPYSFSEL